MNFTVAAGRTETPIILTLKEFGLVATLCCISIYLIYDLKKCLNLEMANDVRLS